MSASLPDSIQWRIHLSTPREAVFELLATDQGRRRFWAEEAPEADGYIHFRFVNGWQFKGKIFESASPERFAVEYFGGGTARFDLAEDGAGGTDLTLTESGVPEANLADNSPGWVSVLLALKAAADFSIELRNRDPQRTWDDGYVDV